MSRFAGMFDRLDTSKPENQYVIVVGGGSAAPAADTASKPSGTAPAAGSNGSGTDPGSTQPDAPSSGSTILGHGFTLSSGFEDEVQKPAAGTDKNVPAGQADHQSP
jgi:hypothetical protein